MQGMSAPSSELRETVVQRVRMAKVLLCDIHYCPSAEPGRVCAT